MHLTPAPIVLLFLYLIASAYADDIRNTPSKTVISYKEPKNASKPLSLKQAIEQGLRKNQDQQERDFRTALYNLEWDSAFDKFWMPNISLKMSYGNHLVDRFKTVDAENGANNTTNRAPQGYVGLDFGEYTLFNWGKDYLQYLNDKFRIQRSKENLKIDRRRLRFAIIEKYFETSMYKKLYKILGDQLRHTSFVYRLAREKASLKKIPKREYHEARSEFLRAQAEYYDMRDTVIEREKQLSILIGEEHRVPLRIVEGLKFAIFNMNSQESLDTSLINNPDILTFKQEKDNAERSYRIQKKENLPLPKISVNLGSYKKMLTNEGSTTSFRTHNDNSNIELIASIDFTWTILGEDGLFNSRLTQKSYLNKRIADLRYKMSKRSVRVKVKAMVSEIRQLERRYEVSELAITNSKKSFDKMLDGYLDSKVKFIELRQQIINLVSAYTLYEQNKWEHLTKKLELCDLLGLEDFPGENFENLASREVVQ